MTDGEWLACADPWPMLYWLHDSGGASDRKSRLFAVACCRLLLRKVRVHPWYERGIGVAERYADGAATVVELQGAYGYPPSNWLLQLSSELTDEQSAAINEWSRSQETAKHACWNAAELECGPVVADCAACNAAWAAAQHEATPPDEHGLNPIFDAHLAVEQGIQSDLVREIFGNPFRPAAIDPAWLAWNDSTIPKLAGVIYEDRELPSGTLDAGRLAVLADALEEAGCTDTDILNHCRGPGPHVRGCWVIDLLLGRE